VASRPATATRSARSRASRSAERPENARWSNGEEVEEEKEEEVEEAAEVGDVSARRMAEAPGYSSVRKERIVAGEVGWEAIFVWKR
jgi:hypothetical protein